MSNDHNTNDVPLRQDFSEAATSQQTGQLLPGVVIEGKALDLYSGLLHDNIIVIDGAISGGSGTNYAAQIQYLCNNMQGKDKDKTITILINSPGGSVSEGLIIYDQIMKARASGFTVRTVCTGIAMSMGSVLLVAGSEGHRHVYPNGQIMLHQASGGSRGTLKDADIMHSEFKFVNEHMKTIYRAHTKISEEDLDMIFDRDYYLHGEEAVDKGIVDHVDYPNASIDASLAKVAEAMKHENMRHWHKNVEERYQKKDGGSWKPNDTPLEPPKMP